MKRMFGDPVATGDQQKMEVRDARLRAEVLGEFYRTLRMRSAFWHHVRGAKGRKVKIYEIMSDGWASKLTEEYQKEFLD